MADAAVYHTHTHNDRKIISGQGKVNLVQEVGTALVWVWSKFSVRVWSQLSEGLKCISQEIWSLFRESEVNLGSVLLPFGQTEVNSVNSESLSKFMAIAWIIVFSKKDEWETFKAESVYKPK